MVVITKTVAFSVQFWCITTKMVKYFNDIINEEVDFPPAKNMLCFFESFNSGGGKYSFLEIHVHGNIYFGSSHVTVIFFEDFLIL